MAPTRNGMKGFEICAHTCGTALCVNATTNTPLWRLEGGACGRHASLKPHLKCNNQCPAFQCTGSRLYCRTPTEDELKEFVTSIRQQGRMSDAQLVSQLGISVETLREMFPTDIDEVQMELDEGNGQTEDFSMDVEDSAPDPHLGTPETGRLHIPRPSSPTSSCQTLPLDSLAIKRPTLHGHSVHRILYVPDPSMEFKNGKDIRGDLHFVDQVISRAAWDVLSTTVPHFVFQRRTNHGDDHYHPPTVDKVKVKILEWVRHFVFIIGAVI